MASVMIVDAERLSKTPQAFQDYVQTYFREDQLLGKRVYVATRFLQLNTWQYNKPGVAPRHSIDLARFTAGLKAGETLFDWLRQARSKYFWEFEGGFDSDSVTHLD